MIKLEIVEYKLTDLLNGCDRYRYVLELDNRALLQFESMDISTPHDCAIKKLMASIRLLTDFDLEHYNRFNFDNLGISKKILLEQEVSDHYLKDLKIQRRIEDLKRDFEE